MSPEEQRMRALAKANRIRIANAQIKRHLQSGRITLGEALQLEPVQSMPVERLLTSKPRWGRAKARRTLKTLGITGSRRVGELTNRELRALWIAAH